ncbi:hypothetical protein BDY21DRAFT_330284 [Lineolata rhizophorae]|uniref:Copper acquisition factor BIM1-like domain-containing protein n=1 Tax=Lineolata rhizophorae TaxID=578093 RepID=A0A6A6PDV8_9PEZI|nr:hypothetical protein BDY21DRAFT_330284 [Lineolata rhizophorae]
MRYAQLLAFALAAIQWVKADDDTPAHGEEESEEMGPVAFMWPEDREWSASDDNTAPCGSSEEPGERTQFPLTRGALALVIQDDSWNVDVSIAYQNDPSENSDFETLITTRIAELDPGHACYSVPDPPRDVIDGTNATIQLRYTSDFDTDTNETFYACADITYVSSARFDTEIPCFNVTSDNFTASDDDEDEEDAAGSLRSNTGTVGLVAGFVALGSWLLL